MRFLALAFAVSMLTAGAYQAQAQDLEETLSEVGSAYAQSYVRPLADALGANLNGGLFYDAGAGTRRSGFNVYVGVRAFGAFLPDDAKTFDLTYQDRVTVTAMVRGQEVEVTGLGTFEVTGAPTVFGDDVDPVATVTARFDTTIVRHGIAVPVSVDTSYSEAIPAPGVLPTSIVPTAVPHVRLGTVFGTDVMVRWLPAIAVPDVGDLGLLGVGVRHSVSQYAPDLPIDLAVQLAWQNVRVDDEDAQLVDVTTFAASFIVARHVGPLALYGALQTERADIDVAYDLEVDDGDPIPIAFSVRGASKARGLIGIGLTPGPLRLNADYSIGRVNVLSVGLGFAF